MNDAEARQILLETLATVAPEIDPTTVDPTAEIRDEMDLDSMDLLNVVSRLEQRLGITIPERDTPDLVSIDDTVAYLVRRLEGVSG